MYETLNFSTLVGINLKEVTLLSFKPFFHFCTEDSKF